MGKFIMFPEFLKQVKTNFNKNNITENTTLEDMYVNEAAFIKFLDATYDFSDAARSSMRNSVKKDLTLRNIYDQIFV